MRGRDRNARRAKSNAPMLTVMLVVVVGCLGAWMITSPAGTSGSSGERGVGGKWFQDINSGMDAGALHGRPILVLFTADWCPPCRVLKRDVLSDDDLKAYLAAEYVCVKIDLTDQGGPNNQVAADFGVRSIPSLQAFDADGHQLGVFNGQRTPWDLLAWLEDCAQRAD